MKLNTAISNKLTAKHLCLAREVESFLNSTFIKIIKIVTVYKYPMIENDSHYLTMSS